MSSAHVFYLPIMIAVGFMAGYFVGRLSAKQEAIEAQKRAKRRQALEAKKAALHKGEAAQREGL